MHLRRIFVPPIVALCLIRPAFGQTSPPQSPSEARSASRRLLLEDAQAAASANDHERALRLAQTAGNIEMTPSVRVFLAREYVAVGNYASALGAADLCVREADREPVAERRAVYVTTCQSIRTDARRRIGAVTVQLRAAITGLEVRVNDDLVEPDLYGVPRPVNPGLQRVTARAPGYATFEREVALSAGATVEVPIELSPVEVARTPTQTPAPPRASATAPPPGPSLVGPIVVGAAGVAGLGLGATFYALRQGALPGCDIVGDAVECDDPARADLPRAQSMGLAATASFVAGGVLLAGGVAWAVVAIARAPRGPNATERASVWPIVHPYGVGLSGSFCHDASIRHHARHRARGARTARLPRSEHAARARRGRSAYRSGPRRAG